MRARQIDVIRGAPSQSHHLLSLSLSFSSVEPLSCFPHHELIRAGLWFREEATASYSSYLTSVVVMYWSCLKDDTAHAAIPAEVGGKGERFSQSRARCQVSHVVFTQEMAENLVKIGMLILARCCFEGLAIRVMRLTRVSAVACFTSELCAGSLWQYDRLGQISWHRRW